MPAAHALRVGLAQPVGGRDRTAIAVQHDERESFAAAVRAWNIRARTRRLSEQGPLATPELPPARCGLRWDLGGDRLFMLRQGIE